MEFYSILIMNVAVLHI